jgi:methionyl-tRNA formyltransferase
VLTQQRNTDADGPSTRAQGPLDIVVLSCGTQGVEVARALRALAAVRSVALVTAPYSRRRLSLREKIRNVYGTEGIPGVARTVLRRMSGSGTVRDAEDLARSSATLDPGIARFHFASLHSPECVARLATLSPDLGLVVGTYILKESVFGVPRLGCINLHSGKVPEYRGSAPGFWELYNAETKVGVTIHRVTSTLDAGDIVLQATAPLDPAPRMDPIRYLDEYRQEVLWPLGARMLLQAVTQIADGRDRWCPQDHARARTHPRPDYAAVRELRRRVRARKVR